MGARGLRLFLGSMIAVALAAAACAKKTTSPGPSTGFNTAAGIVYSLDQEPTNYNVLTSDGRGFDGVQVMDRVWPSVFHADPSANLFMDRDLMESVTLASKSPQMVVYNIDPKAVWQDGVPINGEDFLFNWQAQSGLPQYTDVGGAAFDAASNTGYNQISSVTMSPDKFTVTATFSTPFADWKALFSTLAPAHVMKAIGWNKGLLATNVNAQTLISGGPFAFASYTPGKDFMIKQNPKYWGTPSNLGQVDYRFITDSSQVYPALANNEIQASYPQPQLDLVNQLKGVAGVKLDERPGLQYEHLDFNQANPFLSDVNLRKAIAMSVDRKELIAKTVGQFASGIVPDNSHIYVPGQPQYRDNSSGVTTTVSGSPGPYDQADVAGAKALLTANGYSLANGVLRNRAGKEVTLRITSTQGNKLRQSEEAYVINALSRIGIKVTEADTTGLGKTLSGGTFDLIIFAWVDAPFASGNDSIFQTKTKSAGGQNFDGYSNKTVDSLIAQTDVTLDADQEASLYNQVDAMLWRDMVTLPLFQKPTLLVYRETYQNLHNNITSEGPVYNEEQWAASK